MKERAFCTIIARNYLPLARVLFESVLKFHEGANCFVLIVDPPVEGLNTDTDPFQVLVPSDLPFTFDESFYFKYQVIELSTALKPFLLEHLLSQGQFNEAIYLDPDILAVSAFDEVFDQLENSDFVLTPHRISDVRSGISRIRSSLLTGIFNLGFFGIRRSDNSIGLLRWWQKKVFDFCVMDPKEGLFVDQKFMDLSIVLFDGGHILKHPGYNIATWNCDERPIKLENGKFTTGETPVRFFHLSGFRPDREGYSPSEGWFPLKNPAWKKLLSDYGDALRNWNWREHSGIPYRFGDFECWPGWRINSRMRSIYRRSSQLQQKFRDPFKSRLLMLLSGAINVLNKMGLMR